MWKTAPLSLIRAHRTAAILLIVLSALSSTLLGYAAITHSSISCAIGSDLFGGAPDLFGRVFFLASPGTARICLTVRFSGNLPEGLSLTPGLGRYWFSSSGSGYVACFVPGANCGTMTVSSTPKMDVIPDVPIHVVWTIKAPIGSTFGDYLLQYGFCPPGGSIGLEIGVLGPIFDSSGPPQCPFFSAFGVGITVDAYSGLIPTNQIWPFPGPPPPVAFSAA